MSFETSVVFVQFRLPLGYQIPKGIPTRPDEGYAARAEREKSNEHREFIPVLERNGASLQDTPELLLAAGYRLIEASVQQRTKPRQLKPSKAYLLLSFVFSKEGEHRENFMEELRRFTPVRYEFLKVVRNESEVNNAVLSIVGTTPTGQAVELKQKEDPEAAAYGIVVSKAVPKDERTRQQAPAQPASKPAGRSATGDSQLDRLLGAGWKIAAQNDREVKLTRMKDGKPREMTHYRPRPIKARRRA